MNQCRGAGADAEEDPGRLAAWEGVEVAGGFEDECFEPGVLGLGWRGRGRLRELMCVAGDGVEERLRPRGQRAPQQRQGENQRAETTHLGAAMHLPTMPQRR